VAARAGRRCPAAPSRRQAPRFGVDHGQHAEAAEAFRAACSRGSVDGLLRVPDPAVVLRSDGGGRVRGVARRRVSGSGKVARLLLALAARNDVSRRVSPSTGSPRSTSS
jgi:RNA polymerase sigma-70 factor (ECF subfamily)